MPQQPAAKATPAKSVASPAARNAPIPLHSGVAFPVQAAVASLAARRPRVGAVHFSLASDGQLSSVHGAGVGGAGSTDLSSVSLAPAPAYMDALRSGDVVAVEDAPADPRSAAIAMALDAAGVGAILAVMVDATPGGLRAIALCARHGRGWDAEDGAALVAVAAMLARLPSVSSALLDPDDTPEPPASSVGGQCLLWEARVHLAGAPAGGDGRLAWDMWMSDEAAAQEFLPLDTSGAGTYVAAWDDAVGPREVARLEDAAQAAITRGDPTYETEFSCVDATGSRRWLRQRVSVTRVASRQWRCDGVCVEITAREAMEHAQDADARLDRGVFAQSPVGMALVGADFRIVHANGVLCEMLGSSDDALRGRRFADFTHPEDIAMDVEMARQVFAGDIPRYSVEKRYARSDGEYMWGRLTATVIGGARGEPAHGLNVVEDITGRKRAEGDVREELERRIEERASELEDQLADRIETVGELRKTVRERSRLMQQILTVQEEERTRIARELHDQTGQALSSLLIGLTVVESASSLETARARGRQLREVTSQALESVRTLAFDLRPSSLDSLGLSAGVERDAGALGAQIGISVEVHADDNVDGLLDLDAEAALYRVIHSALTNIGQHAGATTVSILLRRRGDLIAAVIEDDGVGFNVRKTLAGPIEGRFGLLAMEERLRPFGGEVSFESTPGGGVTVYASVSRARPVATLDA